ncbi:serine/threonine-protein kinase 11-interacting protein-like [Rhipicephalus sanguineus]|uniref:serine/threonine-protein kinase 11-interacting protein-like n=1 Tax=Rhipicephalus sanguineus TaxID=34632 RepID=UPI001894E757|nr:serine/threonine-protein kinase 11-interacting protein-like [Rhipicephalus sanguineus]
MTPDSNRCERIKTLAAFLREHGDVVLNGTRRLTLTTSCLNELNYIFRQFLGAQENESFDVPFGCSANSDFVHDVFFLHDFMQKTCSLKIVQSSQTIQGSLDLSKFHGLKILELKRVPPHLLVGLETLVLQIETLICQRNISSLKEILRSRNKVPQPWMKIKVANFSYNGITALDDSLVNNASLSSQHHCYNDTHYGDKEGNAICLSISCMGSATLPHSIEFSIVGLPKRKRLEIQK